MKPGPRSFGWYTIYIPNERSRTSRNSPQPWSRKLLQERYIVSIDLALINMTMLILIYVRMKRQKPLISLGHTHVDVMSTLYPTVNMLFTFSLNVNYYINAIKIIKILTSKIQWIGSITLILINYFEILVSSLSKIYTDT